jgi:hypothetical protein
MRLPPELAMKVGSYLDDDELNTCIAELCSSGVEFVAAPCSRRVTKVKVNLNELLRIRMAADASVEQANAASMAQQVAGQIDVYLSRNKYKHLEVVVLHVVPQQRTFTRDGVDYADQLADLDNELQALLRHGADGTRDRLAVQW